MKAERKVVGKPSLRPEDCGDAGAAIVTITGVDYRKSQYGDSRYVIQMQEFPDRELWLSATESNIIIDNLGDDTEGWIGAKVPLLREKLEVRGKEFVAMQVAEDWEAVVKAAKRGKGRK